MADATEILVKSDPSTTQTRGDWVVQVGRGRGGRVISRHRLKSAAVRAGRREGRKRADNSGGAILKVQNREGQWSTESTYGNAEPRRRGLFGLFG